MWIVHSSRNRIPIWSISFSSIRFQFPVVKHLFRVCRPCFLFAVRSRSFLSRSHFLVVLTNRSNACESHIISIKLTSFIPIILSSFYAGSIKAIINASFKLLESPILSQQKLLPLIRSKIDTIDLYCAIPGKYQINTSNQKMSVLKKYVGLLTVISLGEMSLGMKMDTHGQGGELRQRRGDDACCACLPACCCTRGCQGVWVVAATAATLLIPSMTGLWSPVQDPSGIVGKGG